MRAGRDEAGLDLTLSAFGDIKVRLDPSDDDTVVVVFGGAVQRVRLVMNRADFDRFYRVMGVVWCRMARLDGVR
ncbi:hypothetical protein [Allokutzneria albata]|uniref:Uncharacterized protein n=1 Tax=Allokutzneria albata TaxID=211114 RepID=A0A1H0CLE4_ALLAB|nr:hypothetical protein [Allokutzneria albata]SDN58707.1 hypothetical protein SAMN04489726_7296 [Allokutzneria albata]